MSGMPMPGVMPAYCNRCGKPVLAGSPYCTACGAPQPMSSSPQYAQPVVAYAPQVQYAGFWLRFVALIIDQVILSAVLTPFTWAILGPATAMASDPTNIGLFMSRIVRLIAVATIGKWLYYALMESSSKQATIGKLALGLRVTDLKLQPIDFGQATARYFGKILSGLLLCIGFMMAGFTARKQALHDMIAGTLVIRG
ncbi:MAG TPA: RDD family protein [Candidatus Acidoferrales bacterium]|nr:RDD family protein [Candidatus Acidoferrales bacterium]